MQIVIIVVDTVISIHALLAESDASITPTASRAKTFLSTLSLRRATQQRHLPEHPQNNFYPRSPCGERRHPSLPARHARSISIHALLAESDKVYNKEFRAEHPISIHALLAESDGGFAAGSWRLVIFLSTLSLRRATGAVLKLQCILGNFYPRSPCGERLTVVDNIIFVPGFLSTLSLRRATGLDGRFKL